MAEFYAIAGTAAGLTGLTESNLVTEPHPAPFHEFYEIVGVTGEAKPIGAGFPWCEWEYEDQFLTAEAWNELLSFFSGDDAYADVYIRTRTNEIETDAYKHRNFSAIMHRPEGEPKAGYRFQKVKVRFTHLEELT